MVFGFALLKLFADVSLERKTSWVKKLDLFNENNNYFQKVFKPFDIELQ
jgi:hypothetical protein